MVLDRWPDNFFAETEQVAFCPTNIVPGIDFSKDPLLQGRLFSYQDTQLSRLGSPNFHQLPINAPKCPFPNLQRDGHMQMQHAQGPGELRAQLACRPSRPRESPAGGFRSARGRRRRASKGRVRAETFADHYSQARLFFRSQTEIEQAHMAQRAGVRAVEGGASSTCARRMVGHLRHVDEELGQRVADGLGIGRCRRAPAAAVSPDRHGASPALRIDRQDEGRRCRAARWASWSPTAPTAPSSRRCRRPR